jgi:hypothetical protein
MAIKITLETNSQLVVVSRPMYGMGLFSLVLLLLAWSMRHSNLIGFEIVLSLAGLFGLGYFFITSKLTADKPTGNVTIERKHITGLWRRRQVIPMNTIFAVDCDFMYGRSASLVRLLFQVRDAKNVYFGLTPPHYTHGIKGALMADQDNREQYIAVEIEKFLGVYHPQDYEEADAIET